MADAGEGEVHKRFSGPEYSEDRDYARLSGQLRRIHSQMADGEWWTLGGLAGRTGDPAASVSAQLRHLRKERFGSHTVERRYVDAGLFEYRVIEPLGGCRLLKPDPVRERARG